MGWYENMYIGRSPIQNRTDSVTPGCSTHQTWMFPLHDIAIKVPKWIKYEIKAYNFFRFLVCFQYFKVFLQLYELPSEIEVINCRNYNMAVLLNIIASIVYGKVCKCTKSGDKSL